MTNKAIRNIVPVRKCDSGVTAIILAAGKRENIKSYGPRSLLKISPDLTLIDHQVDILYTIFSSCQIVLVGGFEADKLFNNTDNQIVKVENERFEETNVCRSIAIGLRAASGSNRILCIYGDLLYNASTLNADFSESTVILSETANSMFSNGGVGCFSQNEYAENFMYSLPNRWAEIAFFTDKELKLLRQFTYNRDNDKKYGWEALNYILEKGGKFKTQSPAGMKITDLDCSKDLKKIPQII